MEEDREKEEGARKITIVREAFVKENLVKNQTLTIIGVKRFLNKNIRSITNIYCRTCNIDNIMCTSMF